jgi:hypothetical protein
MSRGFFVETSQRWLVVRAVRMRRFLARLMLALNQSCVDHHLKILVRQHRPEQSPRLSRVPVKNRSARRVICNSDFEAQGPALFLNAPQIASGLREDISCLLLALR